MHSREEFFFFKFKREVRKIFDEDVLCILASFDVSFLQVEKKKQIDLLVRLVRPFIHHCSRFGSMQIQSEKEQYGACPGMLTRSNVFKLGFLLLFPCIT